MGGGPLANSLSLFLQELFQHSEKNGGRSKMDSDSCEGGGFLPWVGLILVESGYSWSEHVTEKVGVFWIFRPPVVPTSVHVSVY